MAGIIDYDIQPIWRVFVEYLGKSIAVGLVALVAGHVPTIGEVYISNHIVNRDDGSLREVARENFCTLSLENSKLQDGQSSIAQFGEITFVNLVERIIFGVLATRAHHSTRKLH